MTKLICINTIPAESDTGYKLPLVLGGEYELLGVHQCKVKKVDVGILHPNANHYPSILCACCFQRHVNKNIYFYAWRFIKLDPDRYEKHLQEELERSRTEINPPVIYNPNRLTTFGVIK